MAEGEGKGWAKGRTAATDPRIARAAATLGAIEVPDRFFSAFLRGVLDGDGTISNFVHAPTIATSPQYRYERLWVFFTTASSAHVEWLRSRTDHAFAVRGYVERRPARPPSGEYFRPKYGNRDSVVLLRALYSSDDEPKLDRKWLIWRDYRTRHGLEH